MKNNVTLNLGTFSTRDFKFLDVKTWTGTLVNWRNFGFQNSGNLGFPGGWLGYWTRG